MTALTDTIKASGYGTNAIMLRGSATDSPKPAPTGG
jgi:hypothetical protein